MRAPRPLMALLMRACVVPALLAALFVSPAALGQLSGLPAAGKPAAAEAAATSQPPESIEQQRSRLAAQLEEARAQRDRLASDAAAAVPRGLTPEELSAARNALSQLVLALEAQLRAINEQQSVRAARQEAEKAGREWAGFDTQPPYSIFLVDDLHEMVGSARVRLSALTAQRVIAEREAERARDQAQHSEAALRRAREALSATPDDEQPLRQAQARLAEWSSAAAAAVVTLFQRSVELVDEQIALEGERLKLAERKLQVASRDVRFSSEDLAQIRRREEQAMERIRGLRVKAGEKVGREDREVVAAADALRQAEADPQAEAAMLQVARARLRAAQAAAESARFELDTLESLSAAAAATVDLYTQRFQALNDSDAARRREAVVRLRAATDRFKPWRDYAQSQLELLRAGERESTAARFDSPDAPPQLLAYENVVTESIRQRVGHAQRLLDAADRGERTVVRWLSEIDTAQEARPLGERLAGAWAIGADWARRLWNFEMFAVEDTIEVGGQKITTSRGVTIGKSVGALLLFVIGFRLATYLARYFERLLIQRFAIEQAQARTVRRWVLAFSAFVLLALTLNLARIPLTVFAFLGGALAIGVGFGTQTIIRNFISGLIVLMERQIRVGDTIEVDGVTGTVAEVNLRSSTVRGFDGVEAIIPNSNLLENKVTNWTHTDRRIRRVVRVGVAYGSPMRKVADLLLDCMQRHGQVLKDPEPMVLLEDFGDSTLLFAMYFWLELKPGVNSAVVMSDLRFMVHRSLDEAGIAIPFPQRDVHLDAARPLPVEIVPARPAAAG